MRPDPFRHAPYREPWHRRALEAACFAGFCGFCGAAGGIAAALLVLALATQPLVALP